jgi:hypothetical protein
VHRLPRHGFAAALLAFATGIAAGCQVIDDPTSHSFAIAFRNDTGQDVRLKLCDDDRCRHFDYSHGWKVGQTAEENIAAGTGTTRWLVEDAASGRTLGCLPLQFDHKTTGVLVRISQLVRWPGRRPLPIHQARTSSPRASSVNTRAAGRQGVSANRSTTERAVSASDAEPVSRFKRSRPGHSVLNVA